MPMLDDIAIKLVADVTGFGKLSGTTGNVGRGIIIDDSTFAPNTILGLYDTAGFGSGFAFSTSAAAGAKVAFERPGLQILSRSTSYKTARDNAVLAHQVLDGFTGTLSGTRYLSIEAAQPPFLLGRDGDRRVLFSCNFLIMKDTT